MELVYLWVEEYKNIKNQGFNFSPRFECESDGENLTITEKEHIENFFGKNINITAIVGENGSGKSSVLEALSLLQHNHHLDIQKSKNKIFIVFNNSVYIAPLVQRCIIRLTANYIIIILSAIISTP